VTRPRRTASSKASWSRSRLTTTTFPGASFAITSRSVEADGSSAAGDCFGAGGCFGAGDCFGAGGFRFAGDFFAAVELLLLLLLPLPLVLLLRFGCVIRASPTRDQWTRISSSAFCACRRFSA
jgi:hypothetical protein